MPGFPSYPGRPSTPLRPGIPSSPGSPGIPSRPSKPCAPGSPFGPLSPGYPGIPGGPSGPTGPICPGNPRSPINPWGPGTPGNPGGQYSADLRQNVSIAWYCKSKSFYPDILKKAFRDFDVFAVSLSKVMSGWTSIMCHGALWHVSFLRDLWYATISCVCHPSFVFIFSSINTTFIMTYNVDATTYLLTLCNLWFFRVATRPAKLESLKLAWNSDNPRIVMQSHKFEESRVKFEAV